MTNEPLYLKLIHGYKLLLGSSLDRSEREKYFLSLLILKFTVDNFQDRIENSIDDYRSILDYADHPDFGDQLNNLIWEIDELAFPHIISIFFKIDFKAFNEKNKKVLFELLKFFSELNLSINNKEENQRGDAFIQLIDHFSKTEGKLGVNSSTPIGVADLLSELISPNITDTIYDCACGYGTLLVKMARQIEYHNKNNEGVMLYGQDISDTSITYCKMNFLFNQQEENIPLLEVGDTLTHPRFTQEENKLQKFDVVVSHPPFSMKWSSEMAEYDQFNRYYRGIPPKHRADYAFLSHMIKSAKDKTGKIGIIASHGLLFRGASEREIRKNLIEENILEAVIGLPSNIFYNTSIPGVILLFNKAKKKGDVLFIDASKGFEKDKNQHRLRKQDIIEIVTTYKKFKKKLDDKNVDGLIKNGFSYVASIEEIRENDYNLNIPLYVDTFEEEEHIDKKELIKEIKLHEAELKTVQNEIQQILHELNIM